MDKSKANQLAKTIICIQAVWFMVETLSRIIQGLAVSLLELNTFAHTLCALLIFYFWWHKPLDIEEPTRIASPQMYLMAAMLCYWSKFDEIRGIDQLVRLENFKLTYEGRKRNNLPYWISQNVWQHPVSHLQNSRSLSSLLPHSIWLYEGQSYAGFCYFRGRTQFYSPEKGVLTLCRHRIELSPADQRRYQYASQAYSRYLPVVSKHGFVDEDILDILNNCAPNWNFTENTNFTEEVAACTAFSLAGFAYGAIHSIAWNYPFTSKTQCTLWRVSGVVIAASGPIFIVVLYSAWHTDPLLDFFFCLEGRCRKLD